MGYVTPEEIRQAKEMDLLTYLQNYEPNELVRIAPNTYCTREHDSLKISNGKWCWFSRGIGGKTALDYLIKVQDYPFTQAVETILGRTAARPPVISYRQQIPEPSRNLMMPELNSNTKAVVKYLVGRGIHPEVIDYCLTHRLLFESAIDLLSYATLLHMTGRNWKQDALLSLAGVYKTKRENVVPVSLSRFLTDYPGIKTLRLHLDNDEIGRGAAKGIMDGLKDKYKILDEPPRYGKDVNDALQRRLGLYHQKEECVR